MDDLTTDTIVRDAVDQALTEMREYAEAHDGRFPITSAAYFKLCAAFRLLEEEK
jgi:hypothetical protein